MGSGAKSKHASYPVAPAEPATAVAPPVPASDATAVAAAGEAYTEALSQLEGVQDYQGLTQATAAVLEAQSALVDEGWPPQLGAEAPETSPASTSTLAFAVV